MSASNYQIYATTQDAWDAMLSALRAAEKSIYWEVYMIADDPAGNQFFSILEEKAKAGLDIKLIFDYWGSLMLSKKKIAELRALGIDIRLFEDRKRRSLVWWGFFSSRTHRKILIVDEKFGFIGGVNVRHFMRNWLDIHVRVEGKVVRSLLRSFAKSYIICGGDKEKVRHLLKYKFRVMHDDFDVVYDEPGFASSRVRDQYVRALNKARERVILFSPYYFPDAGFLKALWKAKKRGVRVDLLIPFRSDLRLATLAAFAWFNILRRAGVHIHFLNKMMHGKGLIVDDDWTMVGSSNIDQPSFFLNHEANLLTKDRGFVEHMKKIVTGWMEDAETLEDKKWAKRGRWRRLKEWVALKLYHLLFRGRS